MASAEHVLRESGDKMFNVNPTSTPYDLIYKPIILSLRISVDDPL